MRVKTYQGVGSGGEENRRSFAVEKKRTSPQNGKIAARAVSTKRRTRSSETQRQLRRGESNALGRVPRNDELLPTLDVDGGMKSANDCFRRRAKTDPLANRETQ